MEEYKNIYKREDEKLREKKLELYNKNDNKLLDIELDDGEEMNLNADKNSLEDVTCIFPQRLLIKSFVTVSAVQAGLLQLGFSSEFRA